MCGIFGFVGFEDNQLLRRMADVLVHRGPDDEGFFTSGRLSMGMRRLSIIDLAGGSQPIFNEDKTLAVCFNGLIYNYIELVEELEHLGHRFATRSDTEVIVHAYEQWGIDCVDHFNGMFAFALYDIPNRDLFLARDRVGQKPLYYYYREGRFLFASEIKALLESDHVSAEPNPAAIDGYLTLRYTPQPQTFFKHINVLPAGHRLRLTNDCDLQIDRYWGVTIDTGSVGSTSRDDESDYVAELEALFLDSIELTMRSDVPVGAYLSGGIDSSLIVAAMCNFADSINTYSLGFNSPIDESEQARTLAKRLGTNHHEVNVTPQDFDLLPKAVWHMDRPLGDPLIIAYYKLAEAASRDVKVVLAGEGADELFAGYSFHNISKWTERYSQIVPAFLNKAVFVPLLSAVPVPVLNKLFNYPASLGRKGKQKTVDFLYHYHDRSLSENYVALRSLWDAEDRAAIYTKTYGDKQSDEWIHQSKEFEGPFLDRLLKLQFDDWLQDNTLLRQDKNTMAHSLELRLPFLDHRLIEFAFRLPSKWKLRGLTDKVIEREVARKFLPPENVKRPKNPFYLPIEFFYEHPTIDELIKMTLDEERVRKRGYFKPEAVRRLREQMQTGEFVYVKQVLSLVILELWHMLFIDREQLW
ncbi:MAG: asparagine synthase (glutamine-hydrolyzing) [Bacteroidetes bacterium]|nr:asparagine synthase (glutamine-hydrolyzing) [Bacteroidota bacterium]